MDTIKDDITGEVFYRLGNSRVINENTPIVKGGARKDVIPELVSKFGFIELNSYTSYILTVCSYACPPVYELEGYLDRLKFESVPVKAVQILHDMLYDKDSDLIKHIQHVYLDHDSIDTDELPKVLNIPPKDMSWSLGCFTINHTKYLRVGTRLICADNKFMFVPGTEVYNAAREMVGLPRCGENTLSENEAICFIAGLCPFEAITSSAIYGFLNYLKDNSKTYCDYYPDSVKKLIDILDSGVIPYRSISDIVTKRTPIQLRIIYAMFGQMIHSQLELGIIQDIQALPVKDTNMSVTAFFNFILSSKTLSVCRKSFLLNVMLGPIAVGGKLPKRFMNVNRNLQGIEGVKDIDFQKQLSLEELQELSHLHTGLVRSVTYKGLVTFLFDKQLKELYPQEYIAVVKSIYALSSSFVCNVIDDVHRLLNLGSRRILTVKPDNIKYDILRKENNWSYVHGCLYNYLEDGGEIDLSEYDEKIVFDESSARLVIAVIGFSTGVTNVKLYRWLFELAYTYVGKYSYIGDVDGCITAWLSHLHRRYTKQEELLYWIFRYKEDQPMFVDSYVQNLSEKTEI